MGSDRDHLTKLQISQALGQRSTRVAVLIIEGLSNIMDLIEEQPSAVVEALLDYAKEKNRTETDEPRREVRKHYIGWFEVVLEEAKRRERRLLHGITGIPPNNEQPS